MKKVYESKGNFSKTDWTDFRHRLVYKVKALIELEEWQGVRKAKGDIFEIWGIQKGNWLGQISGQGYPIEQYEIDVDIEIIKQGKEE